MSKYKITLDPNDILGFGAQVLADEPEKLKDLEFRIFLDKDRLGVFTDYEATMEFWGDGFDFLDARLDDITKQVEVKIELQDDSGVTDITLDGIIYADDIINNVTSKFIKTKVNPSDLSALILRHFDTNVQLPQTGGQTLKNNPVATSPVTLTTFHGLNGGFGNLRATYKISDAIQYILDFISDNIIQLDSDFYQTDANNVEIWRIDVTGTMSGSERIIVQFTNYFGEVKQYIQPFTVNQSKTLDALVDIMSFQFLGLSVNDITALYDMKSASFIERITSQRVDFESWVPLSQVSVIIDNGAGGPPPSGASAAIINSQAFADGMRDVAFSTGIKLVTGSGPAPVITLGDLLKELNKYHNIYIIPFDDSGTKKLKIIRADQYYASTVAAVLNNVNGIEFSYSDSFSTTVADISTKFHDADIKNIGEAWGTGNDVGETLDLNSDFIPNANDVFDAQQGVLSTFDEKDDFFLVEYSDITGANAEQYRIKSFRLFGGGQTTIAFSYNAFLTNANRLRYWLSAINFDSLLSQGRVITNNEPIKIKKLQTFTDSLSKAQIASLLANPLQKFQFSETSSDHTDGWIQEIKGSLITRIVNFKLFTE